MASEYLLDPCVRATPPQPAPGALEAVAAVAAKRAAESRGLQVVKLNPLVALAVDTRDRTGGCLVKTGTFLSTAVGSLAVVGLTAAGVALAGSGVLVTEIVAGGLALNVLFGWLSKPLIAAGAIVLGEKPRATIRRILG